MEQKFKNVLARVASETLERLAFLFTFADDERNTDGPEPAFAGRVNFDGYFKGSLMIRVSTSVLQELAANMLGMDDDAEISPEEQRDAFKEMLNVICGNALPAIAGNQVEFNIGPPEILDDSDMLAGMNGVEPVSIVRLTVEEGFCDMFFFVEGSLPDLILENESDEIQ